MSIFYNYFFLGNVETVLLFVYIFFYKKGLPQVFELQF